MKEFIDPQGTKLISSAIVYVDRDVDIRGMLLLGALYSGIESNPKDVQGAVEIKQFSKTPNLKCTEYLRTVYI